MSTLVYILVCIRQMDNMRQTYIGTISMNPRIAVYLDAGYLVLSTAKRRGSLSVNTVKRMIMLLLSGKCPPSIPPECAKAAINVLLRGLNKLGEDTTRIQQDVDKEQQRVEDEGRGVYPEKAEPVEEDY